MRALAFLALVGFARADPPDTTTTTGLNNAYLNEQLNYFFTATDPDNDLTELEVVWQVPSGAIEVIYSWFSHDPAQGAASRSITFNRNAGYYRIWVRAKDAEGNIRDPGPDADNITSEQRLVTVSNIAPTTTGISVNPSDSATPGSQITITGSASDSTQDLALLVFYVNPPDLSGWRILETVAVSGSSATRQITWDIPADEQRGVWKAVVHAKDSQGVWDSNGGHGQDFTIKFNQTTPVSTPNVTQPLNLAYSPTITGGNGTGAYQFSIPGQTNWPGTFGAHIGEPGTMLPPPGNQVVTAWSLPFVWVFDVFVRRWGDNDYYESQPYPATFPDGFKLTVTPLAPERPGTVGASDIQQTSFTANWGASAGATKYLLDVSRVASFDTYVGVYHDLDVDTATSWLVTNVPSGSNYIQPGTTYHYRVRAQNAGGTSEYSEVMHVATLPPPGGTSPTFGIGGQTTFTQGVPVSFAVLTSGTSPITVSHLGGAFPSGVSFTTNTSGSAIIGTPTQTGTFNVTLRAINAYGQADLGLRIEVNAPASPTAFVVSTVAGQPGISGNTNSPAKFNNPGGLASNGIYVYIADQDNGLVRRLTISDGTVTTFASGLNNPAGVGVDNQGRVYVVEWGTHQIKRYTASGSLDLTVGSGTSGADDLGLTDSSFSYPLGIAVNSGGNLIYVADFYNSKVRRIALSGSTGSVTTIAGGFFPWSLALNTAGTILYVTDTSNGLVKSITLSSGFVATLPGTYSIPRGVTVDSLGNIYVADTGTHTIKRIAGGSSTVVAGYSGSFGTTDGPGASARFLYPFGIVAETPASLYVADAYNHSIRRMLPDGPPPNSAPLFTSPAAATFANNSFGSFTLAASGYPLPTFSAPAGSLPPGVSLSGSNIDGTPTVSGPLPRVFNFTITATNSVGSVTQDFALTVSAAASPAAFRVSTPAGQVGNASFSDTLPGLFNEPSSMATDGTYVYIADQSNHKIRRLSISSGALSSFGTGLNYPTGVAVDGAGRVYVTDTYHQQVKRFTSSGTLDLTIGSGATGSTNADFANSTFSTPMGIAVNSAGTVAYVADYFNASVRRVNISGSTGNVEAISLGFQVWNVALDATGTILYATDYTNGQIKAIAVPSGSTVTTLAGSFSMPRGVTVDALGNVYVVETGQRTIKKITGSNVVTVAGSSGAIGWADGPGPSARFYDPFGAIATSTTSIYVADMRNHTIRRMLPDDATPAFTTPNFTTFAIGVNGSFTFVATGTPTPTISIPAGVLPPGLTSSGATISGTPTALGSATFTVTATNTAATTTQTFTLNVVAAGSVPSISTQPSNQSAAVGGIAAFRATATGAAPLSYQWRKNGVPLTTGGTVFGATSPTLVLSNVSAAANGSVYDVVVTNSLGSATSMQATLTIVPSGDNGLPQLKVHLPR